MNDSYEKYIGEFKIYFKQNKKIVDSEFNKAFILLFGDNDFHTYDNLYNEIQVNDEAF